MKVYVEFDLKNKRDRELLQEILDEMSEYKKKPSFKDLGTK